jgi:hypothetical protein
MISKGKSGDRVQIIYIVHHFLSILWKILDANVNDFYDININPSLYYLVNEGLRTLPYEIY